MTQPGRAVRESGVPREEIVVTTKIRRSGHGYDAARRSIRASLDRLGLDRIDLYLIHWPNPRLGLYVATWRALIDARADGEVRSIGVSNFNADHLECIIDATGEVPAINQIELHPHFPQVQARALHRQLGIQTPGWSPLGLGGRATLAAEPVIDAARRHGATPAQVVLRWHQQLGSLPIPRSSDPERQRENLQLGLLQLEAGRVEGHHLSRPLWWTTVGRRSGDRREVRTALLLQRHVWGRTRNGPRKLTPSHRLIVIAGWTFITTAPFSAQTQELETTMQIYRNGSEPINRAPESTFTGDVQIGGYFQRAAPSRLSGATVTFPSGSRTPWKVNPVGQTIVVTSGVGWAQIEGEEIVEIRAGDVIWFPPKQRHWEGATPDQAMTYFAIQEGGVRFGEKVSDEEYQKGHRSPDASLMRVQGGDLDGLNPFAVASAQQQWWFVAHWRRGGSLCIPLKPFRSSSSGCSWRWWCRTTLRRVCMYRRP